MSKFVTMNVLNSRRFRGRRNRYKSCGSQSQHYLHIPIPNPTLLPRPYRIHLVPEPIVRINTRIHELLTIFIDELITQEHYIYDMSKRSKRGQYRGNKLPIANKLSKVKLRSLERNLIEIRMTKLKSNLIIIGSFIRIFIQGYLVYLE